MRRALPLILIVLTLSLAGCQSHDAKVADLQKEYDRLSKIYIQDCPGPGPTDIPKPQVGQMPGRRQTAARCL